MRPHLTRVSNTGQKYILQRELSTAIMEPACDVACGLVDGKNTKCRQDGSKNMARGLAWVGRIAVLAVLA
jgi:hypothetical protein